MVLDCEMCEVLVADSPAEHSGPLCYDARRPSRQNSPSILLCLNGLFPYELQVVNFKVHVGPRLRSSRIVHACSRACSV